MSFAPLPPDETARSEALQCLGLDCLVLLENSSDLIHSFDAEGRILYANPAWRATLGYTEDDLAKGLSIFQIVHPDFIDATRNMLGRLFGGDSLERFESGFVTQDGRLVCVEGHASCHAQVGRPGAAAYGIYRDITAGKALHEESRGARRKAAQAGLARSKFLAHVGRQIRTPLDNVISMSSLLLLTGLTEEQLRYARTIDSSGRALIGIMDHILDFGRLDAGTVSLESRSFPLAALIEELAGPASVAGLSAGKKGLNLRWFVANDVPASVSGDSKRLHQVLSSLLDNAVKFTQTGEVRLDVRLDVRSESGPGQTPEAGLLLRFTVMDTGIGLQADACARIFDPFVQADSSIARTYGGSGLGLAISRQIVRLMGGDLRVHSTPGEGSTFWFAARFAPAGPPEGAAPSPEAPTVPLPSRPLRILVAEDNSLNQLILAEQLNNLGHTSATVANGREALAALENPVWDAVLLDCQMPVMDGYETVTAIRQAEAGKSRRRVWVVAVTANGLDGEREACLRAGMDDFLSKPFQIQQLARVIARIPPSEDDGDAPRSTIDVSLLASLAKSKAVNGENLLHRMLCLFIESGPQILDQMDEALRRDDFATAVRGAHKMAGGCSYFGAEDLYSLCVEMERLGRLDDRGAIRSLAPRIRQEYARVELALDRNRPAAGQ